MKEHVPANQNIMIENRLLPLFLSHIFQNEFQFLKELVMTTTGKSRMMFY